MRHSLRQATWPEHEALDETLATLDLADPGDYLRFLLIQREARAAVEGWVARYSPPDLAPPPQVPLIDADIAALGAEPARASGSRFEAPAEGATGVAWVLGGSSMGNRTLLADLHRTASGLPIGFLGDAEMPAFFKALRPRLEQPPGDPALLAASIEAARAVFASFAAVAARELRQEAA